MFVIHLLCSYAEDKDGGRQAVSVILKNSWSEKVHVDDISNSSSCCHVFLHLTGRRLVNCFRLDVCVLLRAVFDSDAKRGLHTEQPSCKYYQ